MMLRKHWRWLIPAALLVACAWFLFLPAWRLFVSLGYLGSESGR